MVDQDKEKEKKRGAMTKRSGRCKDAGERGSRKKKGGDRETGEKRSGL